MTNYETISFEEWERIVRRVVRRRETRLANGSRIITASTPERTIADAIVEDLEEDLEDLEREMEYDPFYEESLGRREILGIDEGAFFRRVQTVAEERLERFFEPEPEVVERFVENYESFSVRHKDLIEKSKKDKLVERGYMK